MAKWLKNGKSEKEIVEADAEVRKTVEKILQDVAKRGDEAVRELSIKFDNYSPDNFILTKEDVEAFANAERNIICEYTNSNTIGLWEVLDRKVQEKNKEIRLPVKQLQLLLSFDNQEFAEKMRAKG